MCLPIIIIKTHIHIMQTPADTYYELSVEKVCQFFAVLLLRQAGKVSQLVVLINRGRPGQCVSYYSSTTVSSWSRGCSLSLSVWRLISVS